MNTSGLILFLTFIIGSQACPACPKKIEVKDSKDCEACTECNYPEDGTKRSMDMWCKNPVCGEYRKSTGPPADTRTCPITYHGLCGLTKCAKGEVKSEGMCKQKESGPETDSMKCCKEKCPHENEILNKAHCQSVVCGQDGHTYTGICALDECGKTKIQCDGPCPCAESGSSSSEEVVPTMMPTEPTMKPMTSTMEPTMMPSSEETVEPTMMPSSEESVEPTMMPSSEESMEPTMMPSSDSIEEPDNYSSEEIASKETMETSSETVDPVRPCPCPFLLYPVCGANGQYYPNPCTAKCAKTEVACEASKKKDCPCKPDQSSEETPKPSNIGPKCGGCTKEYQPNCGVDGLYYINTCQTRECGKTKVACWAKDSKDCPCKPFPDPYCICTKEHNPVCGVNGQFYGNPCQAVKCGKTKIGCRARDSKDCPCKEGIQWPQWPNSIWKQ